MSAERYVALRSFTVGNVTYKPGVEVSTKDWPFGRARLLEEQRFIKRLAPNGRVYRTRRTVTLDGHTYKPSQIIPHGKFSDEKLMQLVDYRYLEIVDPSPDGRASRPNVKE